MLANDKVECRRLVNDLRKLLMKLDNERLIINRSIAINKPKCKSTNEKIKNISKGIIESDEARDEADIQQFRYIIKDRVEATVLVDGETYRKCNIQFSNRSLKAISYEVIRIIKYLKMQILGIASIGL